MKHIIEGAVGIVLAIALHAFLASYRRNFLSSSMLFPGSSFTLA